ncbi:bifunctional metallophosphatase/5'-nucleotidase [Bacillaceae bacterium W0354]
MTETIYIYFTSDLHSYFDNWPKIMNEINRKVDQHKQDGSLYLLLDNGDHIDRSNLVTEASLGSSNVTLLNHANYHVATMGNNEGITLPSEQLYHLYDEATFELVCANVEPINEPAPKWLKPYHIFQTESNIKIGVIGLTAPFQAFYEKIGWTTKNPKDVLDQYIPHLRKACDIIIVLSHLGAYEEEAIADRYPVDIIIGGHTHHLYEQGRVVNDCLITAVGKHGYYYGEIQVRVNRITKEITSKEGAAIKIKDQNDSDTLKLLNKLKNEAEERLSEVATVLEEPQQVDWFNETPLMKQFVHTLKDWTEADCAMLNSGVLLQGFDQGVVTKKDILQSCPHPMNPCTMVLKGDELIEMIRMVEEERFIERELKGFGFRGKKIGKMIYANIELDYYERTNYVETVYVNGKPIDTNKKYKIATADTFSFPQLVPAISSVKEKTYFLPEFIRDLLEECLKNVEK